MNDDIRLKAAAAIKDKDLTYSHVAEEIEISRQNLNDMLQADRGKVPKIWQRLLDYLGLKLIAVEKDRDEER